VLPTYIQRSYTNIHLMPKTGLQSKFRFLPDILMDF